MKKKALTRREFLKDATTATLAGALYLNTPVGLFSKTDDETTGDKTRVVLIRNKDVLNELGMPVDSVIQKMLDEAVATLLNEKDLVKAWQQLVKPDDIVGIKSNVWSYLATPKGLEMSIKKRLMGAGVPEKNIGIRDRGLLGDPIFNNATALVNVRPLRTHHWSGVGSLIKNYIMFVKKPSAYHPDSCANLASIWKLPHVQGKTRLNILVLLTPLFHGVGPHHYSSKHTWAYKGMLVGIDPVAVDSTGVRILRAKRKEFFGEERPINPPPKHIFLADTRHHLGTADPTKIELVKIGWDKDILI
jgi:hypothetical protein